MTPVYEVRTTHSKQTLKDFITFRESVKKSHVTFQLLVIALCTATLTYIGRNRVGVMITFAALTVFLLAFAFGRKSLAISKLGKADLSYAHQSEIHFTFGEREFWVDNDKEDSHQKFKYGEVEYMYADDGYYYVNANNEDMFMIPKGDFTLGEQEKFYDFLSHKTGKQFLPIKLPWSTKFDILKEAWQNR